MRTALPLVPVIAIASGWPGYWAVVAMTAPEGAVGEAQACADGVLGLHPMHARRPGDGRHLGDGAGEAQQQVERVDRLAQQHAAAVAGERAAAGLVIVGLRPPPGDDGVDEGRIAERLVAHQAGQRFGALAEAVLEDDAEQDTGPLADPDEALARLGRPLDRLFHEDVLAAGRQPLDDLDPRIRRRQQQHGIDGGVIGQGGEVVDDGQAVPGGEFGPPLGAAAVAACHLDPRGQIQEAQRMGPDRHPEPDDPDPIPLRLRHAALPVNRPRGALGRRAGESKRRAAQGVIATFSTPSR